MLRSFVIFVVTLNSVYLVKSGEFNWYNGYQYYISYPIKLNWHNAFRYCAYQGMYLIDFHTEQEYDSIVQILKDHRTRFNITESYDIWTSGTELGSEGQRYWETTGHPVTFTAWGPGEPNNWGNIQDCMALHAPDDFLMIDRECNMISPFMCRNQLILADTLKNKHDSCLLQI